MDPYYPEFWKNRTDRCAFEEYFKATLEGLHSFSDIHTLGHLDYIIRYSPNKDANYSVTDYMDYLDEILTFIIQHQICLEINTAGFGKGFSYPHPHPDILKRYQELGGKYVTIVSDAHRAEQIGLGFDKIEGLLTQYQLEMFQI
jgi:histidinol-phosphatase (PHP family)